MLNLRFILLLCLLSSSNQLLANHQVGLWYTGANPDYKPFQTEHGYALTFNSDLSRDFFVHAYINDTDFVSSGPKVGFENIESWTEVGVGLKHNNLLEGLYSYLSYSHIQSEDTDFNGIGFHLGYQLQISKQWSGKIQVGHLDTDFSDIQLIGKLFYQLNDSTALGLAIKDHHNWDMTSYEVGINYRF